MNINDIELNWKPSGDSNIIKRAEFQFDSFDICADIVFDYYADISYLGEFTDEYSPEAIEVPNSGPRDCKYFIPKNPIKEIIDYYVKEGKSLDEATELANEQALSDLYRAKALGVTWSMIGILINVSKHGINLGFNSTYGIEDDISDDELRNYVLNCVSEAIEDAKKNLAKLCECK